MLVSTFITAAAYTVGGGVGGFGAGLLAAYFLDNEETDSADTPKRCILGGVAVGAVGALLYSQVPASAADFTADAKACVRKTDANTLTPGNKIVLGGKDTGKVFCIRNPAP